MLGDDPQNDNNHQGETVESIPLAALLENPDPDFDVVVVQRSKDLSSRREFAAEDYPPPPPKSEE